MEQFTVISLFAGAGGLDIGFERAGFKVIWMNELNKDACKTYRGWNKTAEIVQGDIRKIPENIIPKADVMLGAFPCQSFSAGGKRLGFEEDRGTLYKEYIRVLRAVQPKVFVGENVANIAKLQNGKVLEQILVDFSEVGYNLQYLLINAKDYGVPQDRKRVIIVGVRKDLEGFGIINPPKQPLVTMREILGDMDKPKPEDIDQSGFSSRFTNRNRKRGWDDVSYTIVASGRNCPLHPSSPDMIKTQTNPEFWAFGEGETRKMSWQECSRLQTFPQDIYFEGVLKSKYTQIGNAVPPKIGELWGKEIYKELSRGLFGV